MKKSTTIIALITTTVLSFAIGHFASHFASHSQSQATQPIVKEIEKEIIKEVIPDSYINPNYITDITVTDTGFQLTFTDGTGFYYQR